MRTKNFLFDWFDFNSPPIYHFFFQKSEWVRERVSAWQAYEDKVFRMIFILIRLPACQSTISLACLSFIHSQRYLRIYIFLWYFRVFFFTLYIFFSLIRTINFSKVLFFKLFFLIAVLILRLLRLDCRYAPHWNNNKEKKKKQKRSAHRGESFECLFIIIFLLV